MFLWRSREDQYIVQVHENKFWYHVLENVSNHGLEYCWCGIEPEAHYKVVVMPPRGVEGCFPPIPLSDVDQVIGIADVDFGEELAVL